MTNRAAATLLASALLIVPREARPLTPPDEAVRLRALTTEGVPRGLVTVVVAFPPELRDEPDVTYEVRLTGEIEILGRLSGIARAAGSPPRPLVLTLRVPAQADAGDVSAAEVLFRASSGREFVVPLVLRVSVVRSMVLLGEREMRGMRAGDRLALTYRIANAGNAPDSVRILVRAPGGWAARLDRPALAVVRARGALEFTVSLGVPTAVNVGDHALAVSIIAPTSGEELSTIYTTVGVTGRSGVTAGLVMKPTVATAVSTGGNATFTGLEVFGPVSHTVQMRLQLSPSIGGTGMSSQGLASVGAVEVPFAAAFSGREWNVAAGNTSLQLGELSGLNLVGRGVNGQLVNDRFEARALIAVPGSRQGGSDGYLVGGGFWQETAYGRLGGSASLLSESRNGFGRELRAIAADYRSPALGTFVLGAMLGHRDGGGTQGVGFGGSVSHTRPSERVSLRATHAPGGTAAFGRSTDEWQLEGTRVITPRWSVDGSAVRSWDDSPQSPSMAVKSWSLGNRVAATENLSLTLRGYGSGFSAGARDGIGGFGAEDREVGAGVEWRRELLALSAEVSQGSVVRSTELLSGTMDRSTAGQRRTRLSATQGSERWGVLDASLSLDQTAAGVGIPGAVWMGRMRWSELPIQIGSRVVRAESEARVQRLGDLRASFGWKSGVSVALPGGLDLEISAERNPFFRDSRGRAAWIAAMRLSASTRVFTPRAMGPEGIVWEDRDLDGLRDPMEPGVGGVVVRRGDARATTDRLGRYRLPLDARGRSRLEQSSLPIGLVAHPFVSADSAERLDIPVLPTGSVEVDFTPAPDDDGRVPTVDLDPAIVILRDAQGFDWVGRRVGPATARFEGIPIGSYTLAFDLTRLREPLRYDEGVKVQVLPRVPTAIRAPLRLRAVRLFTPPRMTSGKGPAT